MQKTALKITRWIGSPASIVTHTIIFVASFIATFMGFLAWDKMLLVLTTIVSLEAIYLAIFIQMNINYTTQTIQAVEKDIDEIQVDVGEIQEDIDELQEDVEDISEDVEEMSEEGTTEEAAEEARKAEQRKTLADIQGDLRRLLGDIEHLKDVQR